jgi:glycosyltransferase involved in cell wall biosynthesis
MSDPPDVVPVTVAIPTIGRLEPLRRCLESVMASDPRPAEILVVDQSHDPDLAALVDEFDDSIRVVPSQGLGVARSRNDGLRAATHETVLVTDDDCTVPADWAFTGWRLASGYPGAIVTGRVLPVGDPRAVPSTKDDPLPVDLSSERRGGWLFGNNMVLPRERVLELGGFDERFGPDRRPRTTSSATAG